MSICSSFTPIIDYITSTKHICDSVGETALLEYYAKGKAKPIYSNIIKEERKDLHNLRKDDSCLVPTADKGVFLVITDKDMYIEKFMISLNYRELCCECRHQTKLIHSKVLNKLLDLNNPIGPNFKDQYVKLFPLGDNSLLSKAMV